MPTWLLWHNLCVKSEWPVLSDEDSSWAPVADSLFVVDWGVWSWAWFWYAEIYYDFYWLNVYIDFIKPRISIFNGFFRMPKPPVEKALKSLIRDASCSYFDFIQGQTVQLESCFPVGMVHVVTSYADKIESFWNWLIALTFFVFWRKHINNCVHLFTIFPLIHFWVYAKRYVDLINRIVSSVTSFNSRCSIIIRSSMSWMSAFIAE